MVQGCYLGDTSPGGYSVGLVITATRGFPPLYSAAIMIDFGAVVVNRQYFPAVAAGGELYIITPHLPLILRVQRQHPQDHLMKMCAIVWKLTVTHDVLIFSIG